LLVSDLRKYHGRISFLPVEPYNPPQPLRRQSTRYLSEEEPVRPQSFRRSQSEMGDVGSAGTHSSHVDPIPIRPSASSPLSNNGEIEGLERLTNGESNAPMIPPTGANIANAGNGDQNGDCNKDMSKPQSLSATSPVPTPLLNPLSEPVPEDWVSIQDDFVLVAAIYQTHLAIDMMSTPENKIDDGLIHLSLIRYEGMTRTKLIKLMTAMESGDHVGMSGIETIPCKAFRIEPLDDDGSPGGKGILTCDGEAIDFGPVQGQVLPSCARVMTRK
jgi:hypothetical protein